MTTKKHEVPEELLPIREDNQKKQVTKLRAEEALEALVRDQMGSAYPLDVPLEVSVGTGPTWDAAAH